MLLCRTIPYDVKSNCLYLEKHTSVYVLACSMLRRRGLYVFMYVCISVPRLKIGVRVNRPRERQRCVSVSSVTILSFVLQDAIFAPCRVFHTWLFVLKTWYSIFRPSIVSMLAFFVCVSFQFSIFSLYFLMLFQLRPTWIISVDEWWHQTIVRCIRSRDLNLWCDTYQWKATGVISVSVTLKSYFTAEVAVRVTSAVKRCNWL